MKNDISWALFWLSSLFWFTFFYGALGIGGVAIVTTFASIKLVDR